MGAWTLKDREDWKLALAALAGSVKQAGFGARGFVGHEFGRGLGRLQTPLILVRCEYARLSASAFARWLYALDLVEELAPLLPLGIELAEDAERSDPGERVNVGCDFWPGPTGELVALYRVLGDFAEVVLFVDIFNLDDGEVLTDDFTPTNAQLLGINPPSVDQCVEVQMPSLALVCHFQ